MPAPRDEPPGAEQEVREVAARTGLARRTPSTITDVDRLVAAVGEVAERGWAPDDEENEVGIVCVGTGVRDHTGRVVAALSVSPRKTDPEAAPFDELGPVAAAAAKEISGAFGSPGP